MADATFDLLSNGSGVLAEAEIAATAIRLFREVIELGLAVAARAEEVVVLAERVVR